MIAPLDRKAAREFLAGSGREYLGPSAEYFDLGQARIQLHKALDELDEQDARIKELEAERDAALIARRETHRTTTVLRESRDAVLADLRAAMAALEILADWGWTDRSLTDQDQQLKKATTLLASLKAAYPEPIAAAPTSTDR